ncbi:hypothetical protein LINPERPRIM_LOCUS37374, partial [Linum perenne]
LLAYTLNLGTCTITHAELRGVVLGLEVEGDVVFRNMIILIDFEVVVSMLLDDRDISRKHVNEVLRFMELKGKN